MKATKFSIYINNDNSELIPIDNEIIILIDQLFESYDLELNQINHIKDKIFILSYNMFNDDLSEEKGLKELKDDLQKLICKNTNVDIFTFEIFISELSNMYLIIELEEIILI